MAYHTRVVTSTIPLVHTIHINIGTLGTVHPVVVVYCRYFSTVKNSLFKCSLVKLTKNFIPPAADHATRTTTHEMQN